MNKTITITSKLMLVGLMSFGLSGCGGGGGGGVAITQAWYTWYGSYCGSNVRPGCNYYADGTKISYIQDPYYAPLEFHDIYLPGYGWFTGWGRLSATGIFYDEYGYALNSKQNQSRDLIANAAAAQKAVVQGVAKNLSAKYGLSNEASTSIATTLSDWALIGKSRKRTQADVEAFTKRLTGLKLQEINAALSAAQTGDMDAADQAVAKAANHWSTSPETMKEILKDWYSSQK